MNYSTADTLSAIEKLSQKALSGNLESALIKLPEHFAVEIDYRGHDIAEKVSWYPGIERVSNTVVKFESNDYFEILRTIIWII